MFSVNHQKFMEMDELSLQKVPYFFIIDFLSENVEIYQEYEIKKEGLIIDFQTFSNTKETQELNKKIVWKSYPETL
jgi:para-aminobenzoate synthetase component 1